MYTRAQNFLSATPPLLGTGAGFSLKKSPRFTILPVSKYNLDVTSKDQFSNQNDLSYSVSVFYPNGTIAPSGLNFETGIKDPSYTFSLDDNALSFGGTPQREYSLVFKLRESSPFTESSGKFNVYHNAAQISGISSVLDGTLYSGSIRNRTGVIEINLNMQDKPYYSVAAFEVYSGDSSSFNVVTGTGGNLLKRTSIFEQRTNYTISINEGEQPVNQHLFYKILPYDDFGSGVLYSNPPISGLMYSLETPAFTIDALTGKSIVLLNNGQYSIQTYHSGPIGNGYTVVDRVLNVSGNIVSGGWYNSSAEGDFTQNSTYLFKTIKYLAQTVDATGNVSSREILITDNSTSRTGVLSTGIVYSEYAVSDSNQSAQFLVSGSGYANGSGAICLLSRLTYPTGSYKLLRTLL